MDIGPLEDAEVEEVVALWESCGLTRPWNDPRADIATIGFYQALGYLQEDTVVLGKRVGEQS